MSRAITFRRIAEVADLWALWYPEEDRYELLGDPDTERIFCEWAATSASNAGRGCDWKAWIKILAEESPGSEEIRQTAYGRPYGSTGEQTLDSRASLADLRETQGFRIVNVCEVSALFCEQRLAPRADREPDATTVDVALELADHEEGAALPEPSVAAAAELAQELSIAPPPAPPLPVPASHEDAAAAPPPSEPSGFASADEKKAPRPKVNAAVMKRRRASVKKVCKERVMTRADLGKYLGMSVSAIEGIIVEDASRFGRDTQERFLKGIGESFDSWYKPSE
jgi:hypothetical protein